MKITDIKAGDQLKADDRFTCLVPGMVCVVKKKEDERLFIACDKGDHYLDGQVNADGNVIGLVKV